MRRNYFLLWIILIGCVTAIGSHAQVFPIQSQVTLTPPYSGNLSDYISPGSQRISVMLTANDVTISNYRVKLRVTIEGLGITIRSKQNLAVNPIMLDGGVPLILYGDDLVDYLDPRNVVDKLYKRELVAVWRISPKALSQTALVVPRLIYF